VKLISLYIENFGGLSQYGLEFGDGLTVIEEANGFGKTTLAEFIRAMFYGFPRKAKTLDKSRRQKYTPWNGGKFGGNLVFEADGNRFRVERTFGTTPKGDSFTLIDLSSNKKSNRYSEELGLELFQLDGDSFERSTYMPQLSEGQPLTTDSIRSKLSNLVEDTNDVGNFEKAMAALKAKRSTLVPYRGSGGSVMQAAGQISQLQEQLRRAQEQKNALDEAERSIRLLQQEQTEMQSRRDRLRSDIRLASQTAAAKEVHRQHRNLTAQYEMAAEACRVLESRYPAGIPDWAEIEDARNGASRLEILSSREVTEQDDLDALAFLKQNRSRFEGRIPSEEELKQCRIRCGALSDLREKTMELAERLMQQPDAKVNPIPLILLLLLAAAGIVPGILLLVQKETLLGGMAMGTGAAALAGSIFAVVRLVKARKKLRLFHQKQQKLRSEMDRLTAESERLTDGIKAFLGSYGFAEHADFYGALAELEHDTEDYLRAKTRVAQWKLEKQRHEAEVDAQNALLDAFFEAKGLARQEQVGKQLQQIRDDRKDWEEAVEDRNRLDRELEAFRREYEQVLSLPLPEDRTDLEDLHREESMLTLRLNSCSEELIRQKQRREQLLSQVQRIPEIRDELQQWQEKKKADQKKSDLLDDTMALLEQAKENLSGSYLGPVRAGFAGYLKKLWGEQKGQVLVTPDLEVQLERGGAVRELGYFSAGQTDTVMLCMRLALVDALFREEKPFVILDDPFINLDDAHTAQALKLLKTLSGERQIIYLTCNSSRIPK